ncbi:heparinase II/III family protein [Marinilongibacter aquaticus]|uniref:alginate lyase family protein n=1 Tax=Marinilongibacter aquaticus TaxID=2975157 RepID=UPI0021BD245B|nr:alginate lyase family protein [Marinilongibacter aquaticus]UBM58089.1 heparinase II/III family protein [Marinilongibacter aquaticus]
MSFVLLLLSFICCSPDSKAKNLESLEDLKSEYPEHFQRVLAYIDPQRSGLEPYARALQNGDSIKAGRLLLDYFAHKSMPQWLSPEDLIEGERPEQALLLANLLRKDTLLLRGTKVAVPRLSDGFWNWKYTGPNNDEEYGYSLNNQYYLNNVVWARFKNNDKAYTQIFDAVIKDWVMHNPLPAQGSAFYKIFTDPQLDFRDVGELAWRDIDTGRRLGRTWVLSFYMLQKDLAFSEAARFLMLSSMCQQADFLQEYHKKGHNWTVIEMNGLSLFALAFPEFKKSKVWADYAMSVLLHELNAQVYPDGVQSEISSLTHWVALGPFEKAADNFKAAGYAVNPQYVSRLVDMYNYLAYSMRPDGHQALNNDSDRDDLRPRVLAAAEKYARPDWTYIATNGREGQKPEILPSLTFPWAGIHIFRSGWDAQASWLFFDNGPFGTGHQHADKLHISLAAFGQDMLVDGGRFTHKDYFSFDPKTWRGYFRSTYSHNTILVDGAGQNGGQLKAVEPLVEGEDFLHQPTFSFARGTFDAGYQNTDSEVMHSRMVMDVKGEFVVVADRLKADAEHEYAILWHFAPRAEIHSESDGRISAAWGNKKMELIPLVWQNDLPDLVKGADNEGEAHQGWYSLRYDEKEANTAAIYKQEAKDAVMIWILLPFNGPKPVLKAELLEGNARHVRLKVNYQDEVYGIDMPFDTGHAILQKQQK